jgi:hypothetical protein
MLYCGYAEHIVRASARLSNEVFFGCVNLQFHENSVLFFARLCILGIEKVEDVRISSSVLMAPWEDLGLQSGVGNFSRGEIVGGGAR